MKKTLSLLLCGLLLLTTLALGGCGQKAEPPAMIVNGVEIPQGVINYYLNYGKDYLTSYGIDFTDEQNGAQYLSMVEEQAVDIVTEVAVVRTLAAEAGITVDEGALADAMAEQKAHFADDAAWEEWLTTYELSEDDVNWILEYQLLADALYEQVNSDLTLSDSELAEIYNADPDAYDTYKFGHILIAVEATTDEAGNTIEPTDAAWEEARATAADLISQINDGSAKFEDLAQRYNADSTKNTGGDLGQYITKKASPYVEEFNTAAFQLTEVGEITQEPVRSSFGYHIIKLLDKTTGVGEAKDAIIEEKLGAERYQRYADKVDEALQNVEITQDYVRKYAVAEEPTDADTTDADTADGDTADGGENDNSGETQPAAN